MSRRCTPSSVRAAAALARVARRCGADSKSWNAPSPIPALRAPRRRVFPRRAKRRGSWLRPPPGQRACGLHAVDFFTQQLVAHAQIGDRSEEHTSELQSLAYLVCRLLLEKKKI